MVDDLDHLVQVAKCIDLPCLTLNLYPLLQIFVVFELAICERAVVVIDDLLR